ncbi:SRPBCC family protein [Actibacterium ureilyticum]|uniref:SRPBCC family protein n=1 Tax=Actibacterium ureilyticum TaxID=1590614 RepID=UPI000BAAFB84|nr:SRPBCC family protein [Actibacterium ureilyticum]
MKFSTREDINLPADAVFSAVSDFHKFERAALRRGAEVARTDNLDQPGVGATWLSQLTYRGRHRDITSELTAFDAPERMVIDIRSRGLRGDFLVQLIPLSPRRTRLMVQLELRPRTLGVRVFLQSLRLAKSSLNKRFKRAVAEFARDLESQAARAPS